MSQMNTLKQKVVTWILQLNQMFSGFHLVILTSHVFTKFLWCPDVFSLGVSHWVLGRLNQITPDILLCSSFPSHSNFSSSFSTVFQLFQLILTSFWYCPWYLMHNLDIRPRQNSISFSLPCNQCHIFPSYWPMFDTVLPPIWFPLVYSSSHFFLWWGELLTHVRSGEGELLIPWNLAQPHIFQCRRGFVTYKQHPTSTVEVSPLPYCRRNHEPHLGLNLAPLTQRQTHHLMTHSDRWPLTFYSTSSLFLLTASLSTLNLRCCHVTNISALRSPDTGPFLMSIFRRYRFLSSWVSF